MKFRWRILFFLIGLAGIGVMIWQGVFDGAEWSKLTESSVLILFAEIIGIWLLIYLIHAWAYKVILGSESKNVHMHSMLRICIAGFALNNVTPAGLIGGEPYRIMALRRYIPTTKAASATLTFSIFYALGHFMLWATGAIIYACYGCPGELWVDLMILISGAILLGIVIWSFFAHNIGFTYPFMRFLAKIPLLRRKLAPAVERKKESYIEIDDNMRAFRNEGWRYFVVLGLQYLTRLLEAFEYYLLLRFFAPDPSSFNYLHGLMIMATASLVGNLLFIIPMQAGSRELGTSIALGFIGLTTGVLGNMVVVYRIREMLFIIVGIILVLTGRKYKKRHPQVYETKEESAPPTVDAVPVTENEK